MRWRSRRYVISAKTTITEPGKPTLLNFMKRQKRCGTFAGLAGEVQSTTEQNGQERSAKNRLKSKTCG